MKYLAITVLMLILVACAEEIVSSDYLPIELTLEEYEITSTVVSDISVESQGNPLIENSTDQTSITSTDPEIITEPEDVIRNLEFTIYNFLKLDQENTLLKEEIDELNNDITELYAVINEQSDIVDLDKREEIKELEEAFEDYRDESEHINHMTRVSLCYVEDTFRRIVFQMKSGNYNDVAGLLTDNVAIIDGNITTILDNEPFILPNSDFYFSVDYYSFDITKGEGGVIYEFFDSNNERIYFCVASFIKDEHTWYLDDIESTLEP